MALARGNVPLEIGKHTNWSINQDECAKGSTEQTPVVALSLIGPWRHDAATGCQWRPAAIEHMYLLIIGQFATLIELADRASTPCHRYEQVIEVLCTDSIRTDYRTVALSGPVPIHQTAATN